MYGSSSGLVVHLRVVQDPDPDLVGADADAPIYNPNTENTPTAQNEEEPKRYNLRGNEINYDTVSPTSFFKWLLT
jgi:hypothetical protein